MEKKSSKYSQQSANKSATAESKKNQDVVNGKTFPRTSKKREPPGANGYSKNEQQRKPSHQKTRNFDKRPKPKGQYHGGAKEDTKVVEHEDSAEFGSLMAPGSKKQNLNHLLNFHYEPRDSIHSGSGGRNPYGRSNNYNNSNRWLPTVQRHKYNKELFLQANCQFVVTNDGDYSVHLIDPDTLVDWKLIEQIKIFTSESISCPICLSPPVAGKMTRCGHVYCWSCILHYLSLSDKNWRKCPICYESIHKSDLKSVIEVTQQRLNIGETVKLRLMRRMRGSLLATPVDEINTENPDNFITIAEHKSTPIYSKLLRANIDDVIDIIENERNQLKFGLIEDPHSPENCFIEQALNELITREENLLKNGPKKLEIPTEINNVNFDDVKDNIVIENERKLDTETKDDNQIANSSTSMQPNLPKFFYFYQAEDGQHVYLHAMNVKMLELQFGTLEHCPRTIIGKIVEKEDASITEDLRKRIRYLCHLPLTCTFEIAEIDLTTPMITQDVLYYFRDQLDAREKRRRRRERDEKKREKKITAEENKKMGRYPTPKVHIESHKHFPRWESELQSSSMTIPSPPESMAASSLASSPSHSTLGDQTFLVNDLTWPLNPENDRGPSFAAMLRNENSHSMSTWPSMAPAVPKNSTAIASQGDEDYPSAPTHSQSFGDVLALALEASAIQEEPISRGKAKKNKKRGKATLLFSSGMTRTE